MVANGDNIVAGWYKCQTGETKSAFRSTRASWQAMLVQILWGFQFVECPKKVREKNIIFNVIKYFEDEKKTSWKTKI